MNDKEKIEFVISLFKRYAKEEGELHTNYQRYKLVNGIIK